MSNEVLVSITNDPHEKTFQPLPIRLCFTFGNAIFEEMNKLVQFWKPFENALHDLITHHLHVQIRSADDKLANPSGVRPSMRLYRPMHEGPFHPCNALFMHISHQLL